MHRAASAFFLRNSPNMPVGLLASWWNFGGELAKFETERNRILRVPKVMSLEALDVGGLKIGS